MHVPGWHKATEKLQAEGKLQMVGIIQEQHPDRARLFMQWKKMGWPILIDSLDLLGVSVVPITLALDEYGIIRLVNPPLKDSGRLEDDFLNRSFEKPAGFPAAKVIRPDLARLKTGAKRGNAGDWLAYADALIMWGEPGRISEAIAAYGEALRLAPEHASTYFRLGVAYRKRYDSSDRQDGDFQNAVEHWSRALEIDPNNYIWRRRIQQYGPRLDKPYPFYDWVPVAREEIQARGETPMALTVEPGGAEFAKPLKIFESAATDTKEPDPSGRVIRDTGKFISVDRTVVPPVVSQGASARVHLIFRPNSKNKAHWNNEAEDLVLCIRPPNGWLVDRRHVTIPNPKTPVSQETREIQFELRCPQDAAPGAVTIPAYALYYVCEDVNGTCLYRRKDLRLQVQVRKPSG